MERRESAVAARRIIIDNGRIRAMFTDFEASGWKRMVTTV